MGFANFTIKPTMPPATTAKINTNIIRCQKPKPIRSTPFLTELHARCASTLARRVDCCNIHIRADMTAQSEAADRTRLARTIATADGSAGFRCGPCASRVKRRLGAAGSALDRAHPISTEMRKARLGMIVHVLPVRARAHQDNPYIRIATA
jgi:hypothetical protein